MIRGKHRMRASDLTITLRMADAERYHTLIAECGMTLTDAARFLEVDYSQSKRWARGTRKVPPAVLMLLELMAHRHTKPNTVREIANRPAIELGQPWPRS